MGTVIIYEKLACAVNKEKRKLDLFHADTVSLEPIFH